MYTPISTSFTEVGQLDEYAQIITNLNTALVPAFALVSGAPVTYLQATAASVAAYPLFVSDRVQKISSVTAYVGATAGSGESMVVDVKKNGTSICQTVITIGATQAQTVVSAVLKTDGTATLAVGDKVTVALTYTAGTPTPITGTLVTVGLTA